MTEQPEDPTGLRYYGSDMTIHSGGEVNVELNGNGDVVAVWFRCQPLRFTQTRIAVGRAQEMRNMYRTQPPPPIEAVVLRENKHDN